MKLMLSFSLSFVPGTEDIARVLTYLSDIVSVLADQIVVDARRCPCSWKTSRTLVARSLLSLSCINFIQANMYFTLYAYNSTEQGRSMTRDLKMGEHLVY